MKQKQLNYYGKGYKEDLYSLIIEEDYERKKFYAWIKKDQKPAMLMFSNDMTYEYNEDEITPYDDEYIFFYEIATQTATIYIEKYRKEIENVQLAENQKC